LRFNIVLLYNLNEALKFTFSDESHYPFLEETFDDLTLDPYKFTKISPVNSDQQLLKQLRDLYENNRESMNEDEINLYFWLLCYVEGDCVGPDPLKYEWHHVIPLERKDHELVQLAKKCNNPFLFNSKEHNLINLEKYIKETGRGRHGNHPKYNDWILVLLNNTLQKFESENFRKPSECEAKELLFALIKTLEEIIENDSNLTINQIGKKYLDQ